MFPLLAWLQMRAGDLAMTELAVEIVLLPAGTQLNMSSADVLVDVMNRAQNSYYGTTQVS